MLERPGELPFLIGRLPHDILVYGPLRRSRVIAVGAQPTAVVLSFITSLAWRVLPLLATSASWLGPFGRGFPEWLTGLAARLLVGPLTALRRAFAITAARGAPSLTFLTTTRRRPPAPTPAYAIRTMHGSGCGIARPLLIQDWFGGGAMLAASGSLCTIRVPLEERKSLVSLGGIARAFVERGGWVLPRSRR